MSQTVQLKAFLAAKREQSCQAVYTTFGSRSVIKCIGSLSVRLEKPVWSDPFADRKQTTLGKKKTSALSALSTS